MKKAISVLLAVILVYALMHSVSAAGQHNHVFAHADSAQAGERITIPVEMENNSGFMGYSITVHYDPAAFTPVSAQRGSMLNGLFNDSISVAEPGSFTVVYSGSANCTQDGTLFSMTLDVLRNANAGAYTVEMTFEQPGTFNESWQDVALQCDPIVVQVSAAESVTEPVTEPGPVPEPETVPAQPKPAQQKLSQRMIDWLNGQPTVFRFLLWILVRPLAAMISLFE